jgi:polyferredoxin
MDACDRVMVQVGKPTGLIRYGSGDTFAGRPSRQLRPRTLIYPIALVAVLGVFVVLLAGRADTDVTVLGGVGRAYTLEADGSVMNQLRVKLVNRAAHDRAYRISLLGAPDSRLVFAPDPQPVAAGGMATALVIVLSPPSAFHDGERRVTLRIADEARFEERLDYVLAGPRPGPTGAGERAGDARR